MPPQGIDQLMQLLLGLLTQSPDTPAGDTPPGLPKAGVPANLAQPSQDEQVMSLLLSLLQQGQMMQSGQQSRNAVAGGQGAPYGALGGRPPGS